jgi:hypothetical protein
MKIIKQNSEYSLVLNDLEKNILNNYISIDLKIDLINLDVFCVSKSNYGKDDNLVIDSKDQIKQKIIRLLNDSNLDTKNKIEGIFEKFLHKQDLDVFKKMLESKEVILFKLSSKYKNFIYKTNIKDEFDSSENYKDSYNESSNINIESNYNNTDTTNNIDSTNNTSVNLNKNKIVVNKISSSNNITISSKEFENKGYLLINNDVIAGQFSKKYYSQIKSNDIIGIKGFDNNYYIIKQPLFNNYKEKIINLNIDSSFSSKNLGDKLKSDINLAKIVLQILKEQCCVIEKSKDNYYMV